MEEITTKDSIVGKKWFLYRCAIVACLLAVNVFVLVIVLVADGPAVVADGQPETTWISFASNNLNGGGTVSSPFLIGSAQDLAFLAYTVNDGESFEGVHFRLINDIDLRQHDWFAIGVAASPFRGIFDGNNHRIFMPSAIHGDRDIGLFGTVENARISNIAIAPSRISYIYATDSAFRFGVVVGYAANSTVNNIVNYASVDLGSTNATITVGGIVGMAERTQEVPVMELFNLANHGDISVGSAAAVGGIVGRAGNSGYIHHEGTNIRVVTIFNSYNVGNLAAGNIPGNGGFGGIVGEVVMLRRHAAGWGTSSPAFNIENVYNFGTLDNVRAHQIHGNIRLLIAAGYTGTITNWILEVTNAFGYGSNINQLPSVARFFQMRINVNQVVGSDLISLMQSGRGQMIVPNYVRSAEWILPDSMSTPTFQFAWESRASLRLSYLSTLFGVMLPNRNLVLEPGLVDVDETEPTSLPDNVRFVGWATSQLYADNGVIIYGLMDSILIKDENTYDNPIVLFAVYEFAGPITLTLHTGDGVLVVSNIVNHSFIRPNQFPEVLTLRMATGVAHVGWARIPFGVVEFTTTGRYYFSENITLYAVWVLVGLPPDFPADIRLAVPQHIAIVGNGLFMWSAVANAEGYRVIINDQIWATVRENFVDLSHFGVGVYRLTVTAVGPYPYIDSLPSIQLMHRVGLVSFEPDVLPPPPQDEDVPIGMERLETPGEIRMAAQGLIVWETIDEAEHYQVFLNGEPLDTSFMNHFDISDQELVQGIYILSVRAVGDGQLTVNSRLSKGMVFVVEASSPGGSSMIGGSIPDWWRNNIALVALVTMICGLSVIFVFSYKRKKIA